MDLKAVQKCADDFIDASGKEGIELHSLLIGDRNAVLLEGYWDPYREENLHVMYSISKSLCCMALGLLYEDGLIDLEKPLIEYYPEYDHLAKGYMREVTLHHVLTMTIGTDTFTTGRICTHGVDDDWAANFFSDKLVYKPGTYFQYNTPGSYMIGRTIAKLCGKNPLDLLNERILRKMDIRDVQWDECPLGYNTGGLGLWMRPRDLLKIGQLFLKKGCWEGQQLLSEAWIDRMNHPYGDTSRLQSPTDAGYGYQIWMNPAGGYSFRGMLGQFLYVMPEKDCVFVVTSGSHQKEIQEGLVEKMASSFGDFHGERKETEPWVVPGLFLPVIDRGELPGDFAHGYVEYQMLDNGEGYESVGFYLGTERGYLHLNYNENQGKYQNVIPFGYGQWNYGTRTCKGQINGGTKGTRKTAACGGMEDGRLKLFLRFTESSNAEYWTCQFQENRIIVERHLNCGSHGNISMETLKGMH